MSCGREGVFTAGYMGLGPSVAKVKCVMMGDLSTCTFVASSVTAFNPVLLSSLDLGRKWDRIGSLVESFSFVEGSNLDVCTYDVAESLWFFHPLTTIISAQMKHMCHPRHSSTFKPSPNPLLVSHPQELRARNPDLSMSLSKLGGSIGGGVVAASLSHPMDTIKVNRVYVWVREEYSGYL